MKNLLALVAFVLGSQTALAADSTWLLCKNKSLVVNALEHRAADGESRSISYAMIFGARILKGELPDSQKNVVLMEDANGQSSFSGTLVMAEDMKSLAVKGDLILDGEMFRSIDKTIRCKEMNNRN